MNVLVERCAQGLVLRLSGLPSLVNQAFTAFLAVGSGSTGSEGVDEGDGIIVTGVISTEQGLLQLSGAVRARGPCRKQLKSSKPPGEA